MKKKRMPVLLLCIAMITVMTMAGCAVSDMKLVVGQVGNENVTFGEVTLYANYMLMNQGYSRSSLKAEDIKGLNESALSYAIDNKVIIQKATTMGLYPLSAENQKKVEDNFNSYMTSMAASYLSQYQGSSNAEAQARNAADASLQAAGMTEGSIMTLMTVFEVRDLLLAATTKDVTVTDDEIQAEYNKMVDTQKASYTADPTAYDTAMADGSTIVVYRPAGYRYIKHILIAMPSDIATQIATATSGGDTASVATLRDQGLAQIKDKADEVLAKVKNGDDFDALVAQYGEDPGMKAEPAKTKGYEVGAKSKFVPEFLAGAMGLANVGDTTGLVATDYGYHIIRYASDVPTGPVALDDVKDSIKAKLLITKQGDAFTALVTKWRNETVIKQNKGKIPVITASPSPT